MGDSMKRRTIARPILIVMALLVLGVVYRVSRGAGSGGVLSLFMPPRTITIAPHDEFDVPPGKVRTWDWTVSSRQPRCRVTGRFDVVSGDPGTIQVYVLSQSDFANLINWRAAKAYLRSASASSTTLDVTTTATGHMVLAVTNGSSDTTGAHVRATAVEAVCQ